MRVPSLLVAALLTTALVGCSAGTPVRTQRAAPELGHASVAELARALTARDLPCTGLVRGRSAFAEETSECTMRGQQVDLVHFLDAAQAERFAQEVRTRGLHGALATTWAVVTPDRELAQAVADALGGAEAV